MVFDRSHTKLGLYPSAVNRAFYGSAATTIFMVVVTSAVYSRGGSDWAGAIILLMLTTFGLFLACALVGFGLFVLAVFRKRWSSCIHTVLAFGFIWAAFAPATSTGDLIHLAIDYPTYEKAIEAEPKRDVFRFAWGDHALFVTDGLADETLVYDRSRSAAANVGKVRGADEWPIVNTRHLWGNFFLETESSG